MTIIRTFSAILLFLAVTCGLGGCLYDVPITSEASMNIDTRFLGVFEFSQRVPKRDQADTEEEEPERKIHRVAIVPRTIDTYWIFYRDLTQKPVKTLRYIGWISRVDERYYLSFQDDTEGSPERGKFGFVGFQWKWPSIFDISAPDMTGFENSKSPFAMRQALRLRLKDGTAFPYEATTWRRIARVWWDRKSEDPMAGIPKEFDAGTEYEQSGL